jgi:hypothetical protein
MMAKLKLPPGVSLDKDCWLPLGEFGPLESAIDVDEWVRSTASFWQALETECVTGCCGIEACSFWPGELARAKGACRDGSLLENLKSLRSFVKERPNCVFVSRELNQYFSSEFLGRLLDHIVYYLDEPPKSEA